MNDISRVNLRRFKLYRELELIEKGKCPWCERRTDRNRFRDPLSLKEFDMSGLCGACQKAYFRGNPKPEFDIGMKNLYIAVTRLKTTDGEVFVMGREAPGTLGRANGR